LKSKYRGTKRGAHSNWTTPQKGTVRNAICKTITHKPKHTFAYSPPSTHSYEDTFCLVVQVIAELFGHKLKAPPRKKQLLPPLKNNRQYKFQILGKSNDTKNDIDIKW
jgi:hypothetical protein